ncbi:hypothetical protein AbraIFM66950_004128 [Aspergillus brasiliensis]|nr:hypothetical protein AbraIFM66950_004128 [Aspergillus brasiliensis]
MPSPETPHHREVRHALREVNRDIEGLQAHRLDYSQLPKYKICLSSMSLDETSSDRPGFFTPCSASMLLDPDDEYDRERSAYPDHDSWGPDFGRPINCARFVISYVSQYVTNCAIQSRDFILDKIWSPVSTSDEPFRGLWQDQYPEFGTVRAEQVQDRSKPHMKGMLYNNLDSKDGELLRGEILAALGLAHTQMRRRRLYSHITAPVLLFSFMGPQHARVIEAYFNGAMFVMRTTRLFDLREKDEAVIKTFGQWYLGEPTGDTRHLRKL